MPRGQVLRRCRRASAEVGTLAADGSRCHTEALKRDRAGELDTRFQTGRSTVGSAVGKDSRRYYILADAFLRLEKHEKELLPCGTQIRWYLSQGKVRQMVTARRKRRRVTVRNNDTLDFPQLHQLARFVPSRAACLGAVPTVVTRVNVDIFYQLCVVSALPLVRGPRHHELFAVLIRHDLENSRTGADLDAHKQPVIEELDLLHGHVWRPTPVRPVRLVLLVVVLGAEIGNGVDEAQNEAVRSPVDDDVDGHVV